MNLGELIRLLRQRLADWIAPRPLAKPPIPEWNIIGGRDEKLGAKLRARWEVR